MWKLRNINEGKLSCDNFNLEENAIPTILAKIQEKFNIYYDNHGGISTNMVVFDFFIDGEKICIGYDNWSGVFIMPKDKSGNEIIKRIFEYFSKQ